MKYVVFIIWMFATLFLVASVIGMFLLINSENGYTIGRRSTWMQIGMDLKDKCLKS